MKSIRDTTAPIKSPPISNRKLTGKKWYLILCIFNYHVKYRSYLDLQLEEFCVDPTPLRIPTCSKSGKNAGILYRYWTPIMHLNCKGAHQKIVPAAKVFLFWSWNTSVIPLKTVFMMALILGRKSNNQPFVYRAYVYIYSLYYRVIELILVNSL